jgi:peroxiredoxin
VANSLHLPFLLVSDNNLGFISALNIPTIDVDGMVLSKRVVLIVNNVIIEKIFYPVFPPNENDNQLMAYLNANKDQQKH